MPMYTVDGFCRAEVKFLVKADSEAEAIEKAKRGDYLDAENDFRPDDSKPAWQAREISGVARSE